MPNKNFCSFIANYWNAVACRKVIFSVPNTTFNVECLKKFLEGGYVRVFFFENGKLLVKSPDFDESIYYNKIMLYSTPKWIVKITLKELLKIKQTGGYFLVSTPCGVLSDIEAIKIGMGGILLLGIF